MPGRILVVDDVRPNRELIAAHLEPKGYEVQHAADGIEALEAVEAEEPDLVLLDIEMPRMDGISLCRRLKADPMRRLIPIVLITAFGDRETRLRGLDAGADDFLTKPFDAQELLVRTKVLLRDRRLNKHLDAAENVILALARVVEARDLYTVHHAERVGQISRAIGELTGRQGEELENLRQGGILHDVGKAVIPSEILLKRGRLTPDEQRLMQGHSEAGERICLPLRSVAAFLPMVRHHHEWWNGAGYPDHLAGTDIPWSARVAAIADSWDAMTSDRPYRAALGVDEAARRMKQGAGEQWDPELADALLHLLEEGTIDRIVRAQDDERSPRET